MYILYRSFYIAAIFCLCFNFKAYGANTIRANTCSQSDVQTAINSSSDGDTVIIPAGTCTWSSKVTMNKAIRLTGAGVGVTVISNNYTVDWNSMLSSNYSIGERRIDNFTINGRGANGNSHSIGMYGAGRFRIDHMSASNADIFAWIASPYGGKYGLVEYCTISAGTSNAEVIQVISGDTSTTWAGDNTFGTEKAVYIENCTFTKSVSGSVSGHAVAGGGGARYVFRYNNVADMDVDAHGVCGNSYGTRHVEVYGNTFSVSAGKSMWRWLYFRGGTGIVYNNNMTANVSGYGSLGLNKIDLQEHQLTRTDCPCYMGSYPAPYQIGRGKNQTLDPYYFWNNKVNGTVVGVNLSDGGDVNCNGYHTWDFVVEDRDYVLNKGAKPGYTPFIYPHPLTESSIDISPPDSVNAPTGVKVVK
jgi:hypothetical protein